MWTKMLSKLLKYVDCQDNSDQGVMLKMGLTAAK